MQLNLSRKEDSRSLSPIKSTLTKGWFRKGRSTGELRVKTQSIFNKLLVGQVQALKNELQKHEKVEKTEGANALSNQRSVVTIERKHCL
jgi:hypothetical protein